MGGEVATGGVLADPAGVEQVVRSVGVEVPGEQGVLGRRDGGVELFGLGQPAFAVAGVELDRLEPHRSGVVTVHNDLDEPAPAGSPAPRQWWIACRRRVLRKIT
jgi:hypothetical protein